MPRRELIPLTYRGIGLTTIGRRAFFEYDSGAFDTPRRGAISVDRIGRFPSHNRVQPEGKTFPLNFVIKVCDSQQQFEAITKILDPELGIQTLRLEDLKQQRYRLRCIPQQAVLEERSDRPLTIPLWAPEPFLEDDTLTTAADTLDGVTNPATFTLRNNGTAEALPVIYLTPRQIKTNTQRYTKTREITYANISEFSLTGPGSNTWLLRIISGWDTATLVGLGQMQADGDDIAVFVDDVQVPPERVRLVAMNTASTAVWIEIADAPAQNSTLKTAIAAGTTTFTFRDEEHGFKVGDYLVWLNNAAAYEQARVNSVDGADVTVTRSVRNTTAGAASISATIYRSGHHIQLAWNWSAAPTRPTDPDPPLINLATSSNLLWEWIAAPLWPDNNRRPGGWRRILYDGRDDIPELRKNRLQSKVALDISGASIRFADIEPTAGRPNFDAVEFRACCGIDDVAGAIEYDASMDWPFCLQIIGRDLLGLDTPVFNRLGVEVTTTHFPPRLYTNQAETPSSILSAVIIRARQLTITTCRPGDGILDTLALLLASGNDGQGFTLDENTQIAAIVARVNSSAGTPGFQVEVREKATAEGPGRGLISALSAATPVAGFSEVCSHPGAMAAFTTDTPTLAAGEYFLVISRVDAGTISVPISQGSIYALGSHWEHDGTAWVEFPDEDIWFAILSLTADNQEDAVSANRTGEELTLTNIKLTFDPARVPIVDARTAEDAYYFDTEIVVSSEQANFRFLQRWADALNNSVLIDVKERTVTTQNGDNIRAALEVTADPWLPLGAGNNTMTVEELGGAVEEDVSIQYRHTWQT